jgi:hypothetical protein
MTTRHVARHERKSAPPGRPCFSDAKNTTALSAPACERVRAGVLDRSLSHGGALAGRLEQHVGNCVVRVTSRSRSPARVASSPCACLPRGSVLGFAR